MADIQIREAREGDAEALIANLRPQDVAEVEALLGPGRERHAVVEGMRKSMLLWVGTVDGAVACIFGVVPIDMLAGQGAPWLLGTPLIDRHRSAFIRRNRAYIARMLAAFPTLLNIVDVRNTRAIAWLKRMGFTIHPPMNVGAAGLPFHPFTMGVPHV